MVDSAVLRSTLRAPRSVDSAVAAAATAFHCLNVQSSNLYRSVAFTYLGSDIASTEADVKLQPDT